MRPTGIDRLIFQYDKFVAYFAPILFDRASAYNSLATSRLPEAEDVLKQVAKGEYGYRKGVDDQVEALDALAIRGTETSLDYVANALTPENTNGEFTFFHMHGNLRERIEAECQERPEVFGLDPVLTCKARSNTYRGLLISYQHSIKQHPNPPA